MTNKIFEEYYNKLNKEQQTAVDQIEGPVMVIAGPGTGKTQILAMRIANILLRTDISPGNILCLTFTNSAVYEMKQRLLKIIGSESYKIHIHTYHSFCNEVINTYPEYFANVTEINQITDLEQIIIIKKILDNLELTILKPLKAPYLYVKTIIKMINDLKQEDINPNDFTKITQKDSEKNQDLAKIYAHYQQELEKESKYDYSDMILLVLKQLKKNPDLLRTYQEKFQYFLIDEYQDTNNSQNEIVNTLASFYDNPNIFVVGDDEQSIFRFQGASLENILFFSNNYPQTKIIVLEKNYRSTQNIIDATRSLISNNKNQIFNILKIKKKLKSQTKSLGKIYFGEFEQNSSENYFIAKEIQKLVASGQKPSEIAVIYKEHRDAEDLTEILAKLNIPYQMEIGENILDDLEIRKIINILFFLEDLNNDKLLFEILHYPFWKIKSLAIYKITNSASKNKTFIFEELLKNKTLDFAEEMLNLRTYFQNHTFAEGFDKLINDTGYLKYLLNLPDSLHHLNRLQSLFSQIKLLNLKNKNMNLATFKKYIDSLLENDLPIKENPLEANFEAVRLMTAHKSKGHEFATVFILHASDGHWGNSKKRELIKLPSSILKFDKLIDAEEEEEERRLFYVALTRAKSNIYLTYAKNYGDTENSTLSVQSKFISEIPTSFYKKIESYKYEKNINEKLSLQFSPNKWLKSKTIKDYLDTLIGKFQLSATSLNAYLECPYGFFLNQLIRVPKVKDFNQAYGTAVHKALELFFKKYLKTFQLPAKKELIDFYTKSLDLEILTDAEVNRAINIGGNNLKKYYNFYSRIWKKQGLPLSLEYSFYFHNVRFRHIPITGKIDKIELTDKNAMKVKITDYKTSAPKTINQLLGLTKDKNLNEYYQAYFYKLLTDCDPQFAWQVGEIVFDFLSPQKDKFKQICLPIEPDKYLEFQKLVEEVYQKIKKHEFPCNKKSCKKYNRECEYFHLCRLEK